MSTEHVVGTGKIQAQGSAAVYMPYIIEQLEHMKFLKIVLKYFPRITK